MEQKFFLHTEKVNNPAMPTKDTIGHLQAKLKVNCFTEFAPLKGVVSGYMDDSAQIPQDCPVMIDFFGEYKGQKYPKEFIKRCQDAQNIIAQRFMDMGIEVLRPGSIDHSREYELEGQHINGGLHTFSPRDILFYYHDSVYECPTVESTRVHETDSMDWFLDQQRANGAKWYDSVKMLYGRNKPLFDSANLMKIGFDIVFLISVSGKMEKWKVMKCSEISCKKDTEIKFVSIL